MLTCYYYPCSHSFEHSVFTLTLTGSVDGDGGWIAMPNMQQARGGFGMVLAKDHIVAIGGSSVESQHLRTTEVLNIADLATATSKWVDGPQMTHERRYPSVVVQPMV